MRNARYSVIVSPLQPLLCNRRTAQPSARLFFLGRCVGSLLLLIVLTAGALGVVSTILVFESTKDLMGNTMDPWQSMHLQSSGNEGQGPRQK